MFLGEVDWLYQSEQVVYVVGLLCGVVGLINWLWIKVCVVLVNVVEQIGVVFKWYVVCEVDYICVFVQGGMVIFSGYIGFVVEWCVVKGVVWFVLGVMEVIDYFQIVLQGWELCKKEKMLFGSKFGVVFFSGLVQNRQID